MLSAIVQAYIDLNFLLKGTLLEERKGTSQENDKLSSQVTAKNIQSPQQICNFVMVAVKEVRVRQSQLKTGVIEKCLGL